MTRTVDSSLDRLLEKYLARTPIALGLIRAIEAASIVNEPLPSPMLDLGCGDGLFTEILLSERADAPETLIGVDLSGHELVRARQRHIYDGLTAADIRRLPFLDGSFRCVLANSVLEHIPGLDEALREIHRILSGSGRFLALAPSDQVGRLFFWTRVFGRVSHRWGTAYANWKNGLWRHHHLLNDDQWRRALEAAGFIEITVRPLLSSRVTAVADLAFPAAAISRISLSLFDRWLLIPSQRRGRLLARWLNQVARSESARSAGFLISAQAGDLPVR